MKLLKLRKYNNRKLYLPKGEIMKTGAYVSLKQVRDLIKLGHPIRVTRNKDGVDVTNDTLREILTDKDVGITNEDIYSIIKQ